MDEPYIFFEDVMDAAGNPRQLQTTKLKYTDDAGRLCLLGIVQDVTDTVLACELAVERGYRRLTILGGTGGRAWRGLRCRGRAGL